MTLQCITTTNRNAGVVLAGVVIYHESINSQQQTGYMLSLVAFGFYTYYKTNGGGSSGGGGGGGASGASGATGAHSTSALPVTRFI